MATYNFKDVIGKSIVAKKPIQVYSKPGGGSLVYTVQPGLLMGTVTDYATEAKDPWSWIKIWEIFVDKWVWYQLDDTAKWFRYDESGQQFSIKGESSAGVEVTTGPEDLKNAGKQIASVTTTVMQIAIIAGVIIVANNLTKSK
jgi:hypothetical protein